MELKFKNVTKFNDKMYDEFLRFHTKKNLLKYIFSILIIVIALSYVIIYNIKISNIKSIFLIFIFMIFIVLYKIISPKIKIKQEKESKKIKEEYEFEFWFYEDYFLIKRLEKQEKFLYRHIYRAYETNNFFYLYINKDNAFILNKKGFLKGSIEDFKDFISVKCILKK